MMGEERLIRETAETEAIVKKYLPPVEGFQKTVLDAMDYSVNAGGKRLRPLLMRESYRLFGGTGEEIEPFMAAMEMIHTSSLIHDDLPCMDNDTLRRGKPTAWVKYGYDMAVLAGDGLMIYAFETAAKALALGGDPAKVGRCMGILAEKTGIYGMIGGQTVDVELTNQPIPREKLDFIYRLNRGALLEASLMIGAVLAGAGEKEVRTMEEIASLVGLAFQIQDDILDVTGDAKELGKPVLSDEKNNKTTYVTLEGLQKAREDVKAISARAVELLASLDRRNEFLEELINMLTDRRK